MIILLTPLSAIVADAQTMAEVIASIEKKPAAIIYIKDLLICLTYFNNRLYLNCVKIKRHGGRNEDFIISGFSAWAHGLQRQQI